MKTQRFCLVLATILSLAMMQPVLAQKKGKDAAKKAAEEKKRLEKEWKNRAKSYVSNPLALKAAMDNNKKQVDDLLEKNATLNKQAKDAQADMEKAQADVASLKQQVEQLQAAAQNAKPADPDAEWSTGLHFKVQIGAFKNFDASKYAQKGDNFSSEQGAGMNKYTLGRFRDIETAEAFRKDLERMGLRGAWSVPYKDGVRIEMKEAKQILGLPPGPIKPRKSSDATEEPKPTKKKKRSA
jgi:hypothetical protein